MNAHLTIYCALMPAWLSLHLLFGTYPVLGSYLPTTYTYKRVHLLTRVYCNRMNKILIGGIKSRPVGCLATWGEGFTSDCACITGGCGAKKCLVLLRPVLGQYGAMSSLTNKLTCKLCLAVFITLQENLVQIYGLGCECQISYHSHCNICCLPAGLLLPMRATLPQLVRFIIVDCTILSTAKPHSGPNTNFSLPTLLLWETLRQRMSDFVELDLS